MEGVTEFKDRPGAGLFHFKYLCLAWDCSHLRTYPPLSLQGRRPGGPSSLNGDSPSSSSSFPSFYLLPASSRICASVGPPSCPAHRFVQKTAQILLLRNSCGSRAVRVSQSPPPPPPGLRSRLLPSPPFCVPLCLVSLSVSPSWKIGHRPSSRLSESPPLV